ncbi:MAG TPA: ankyrin repeat domain-containing protein, partial [Candidatus Binatia bacterium]|nr:ankyrin repeat domain-containing protein [Candidatus Binatia bacterium]
MWPSRTAKNNGVNPDLSFAWTSAPASMSVRTTALHWAVYNDDAETAGLLVRRGANVKAANGYGVPPLSLACTNGNA